jgi:hypothetical protein
MVNTSVRWVARSTIRTAWLSTPARSRSRPASWAVLRRSSNRRRPAEARKVTPPRSMINRVGFSAGFAVRNARAAGGGRVDLADHGDHDDIRGGFVGEEFGHRRARPVVGTAVRSHGVSSRRGMSVTCRPQPASRPQVWSPPPVDPTTGDRVRRHDQPGRLNGAQVVRGARGVRALPGDRGPGRGTRNRRAWRSRGRRPVPTGVRRSAPGPPSGDR